MPDDELDRLRAANPVDPASLPSANDQRARALFERITMTGTDIDQQSSAAGAQVRGRPRLLLAAAAAVLVVAVVGGAVALSAGDDGEPDRVATEPTTPTTSGEAITPGEPITPGGPSSASCVELYDLQTLTNRELAFDGTVEVVEGDTVTFAVNHWYRGGDGGDVKLRGAELLGGLTSAGTAVSLEPGSRLLVAGDGGFAWSCGFTQPYDASVAADWAAALEE